MRTIVVGAGHNGLACACYLARAGHEVLVLEQSDKPGGGSRTDETVPGYRFDTHSVAHNIINMTGIPRELDLAGAGLEYREMDPFAVALFADGRRVRFHRSIERTVASIAELDRREAERYRAFMADAVPIVAASTVGLQGGGLDRAAVGKLVRRAPEILGVFRRRGPALVGQLLGSYERVLRANLDSDLTRGPIAAFAAHAGASPLQAGGAFFALWQAAYHLYGQWHAVGGAQGLTDALVHRLEASGGVLRCDATVARLETRAGRVRAVVLEDGERLEADRVVTAIHPHAALLELLDPPLAGAPGRDLRSAHAANSVQALLHVATDRLPPYTDARPGDWNGLQSYVDSLDDLQRSFAAADARRLGPDPLAAYAFTTSAIDDTLAPSGHHTVYLACPAAPFRIDGGWDAAAERFTESLLTQVEDRAPGFRDSIIGTAIQTPEHMERQLRWPGAHPLHLDVTPDQLSVLRPTAALSSHRVPGVTGLYVSGAGTAPVGGIAAAPGRAAARALLQDLR
ncbi:MAG: NAD(P)/FAD-dependent oxidoreductase [Solirubrobacterales bacterium]|nr:NAD(P)/FAD-dependent oxidoreductase [Solirubrobacterales bacterium]